jgi:type II secretory pathway component PulK
MKTARRFERILRPRRERGVALLIALILVALAAILATKLTFDGWIERRRAIGIMATEQAFHFGMGAEALAADVLTQSMHAGASMGATHAAHAHHAR